MNTPARFLLAAAALALLAACSERPQTASGIKSDTPDFQGTGTAFVAPDWKPGDKNSWEQHLRVRGQRQNEYVRIGN